MRRRMVGVLILGMLACSSEAPSSPETSIDAPVSMTVVAGNNQTAERNTILPDPVVIAVTRGASHAAAAGLQIQWVVTAGNGTVPQATTTTDSLGQSRQPWTMGLDAGAQSLDVRAVDPATGAVLAIATVGATATAPPNYSVLFVWDSAMATTDPFYTPGFWWHPGALMVTPNDTADWAGHVRVRISLDQTYLRDARIASVPYSPTLDTTTSYLQTPACAAVTSTSVTCRLFTHADSVAALTRPQYLVDHRNPDTGITNVNTDGCQEYLVAGRQHLEVDTVGDTLAAHAVRIDPRHSTIDLWYYYAGPDTVTVYGFPPC